MIVTVGLQVGVTGEEVGLSGEKHKPIPKDSCSRFSDEVKKK